MTTLSRIFTVSSFVALAGWVVLFVFPSWDYAHQWVAGVVVTLLCGVYTYLIILGKHLDPPGGKVKGHFRSLNGVIRLFKSPRAVLAGWVHYLAFDLMIGLYIVVNANLYNISHWWLIPCLFFTLMFGPAGLLLYFAIRFASTHEYFAAYF